MAQVPEQTIVGHTDNVSSAQSLVVARRLTSGVWLLCVAMLSLLAYSRANAAPGDVISCTAPEVISRWSGYNAADPLLISDPSGYAHLFWAQRTLGSPDGMGPADSLMYAVWDGNAWSAPNDIFISPAGHDNRKIMALRGAMDEEGRIHLVWIGPDGLAFYSSAPAGSAISTHAWQTPVVLATDQSGMQYSVGIAVESAQTIHIAYARSQEGTSQTLMFTRSTDGGLNWSEPMEIFRSRQLDRGASNIRVYALSAGAVYMTWTEWDSSGNGQAIYFARSFDSGMTWDTPVVLDEREGDEYERDWMNLTVLDDGRLMVLWEGGFRAYPQAQYSDDLGATWSEPIDTFPWLIADNGYAEFLRDGDQRLHVFLVRRVREGYSDLCSRWPNCTERGNAIWHSQWDDGNRWRDPSPVYFDEDANFVAIAPILGNRIVFAWFGYSGVYPGALNVGHCQIEAASATVPHPWPTPTPLPTPMPTASSTSTLTLNAEAVISPALATAMPPVSTPRVMLSPEVQTSRGPGMIVLSAITPALIFVLLVSLAHRFRRS
jgi:hypothetical protein